MWRFRETTCYVALNLARFPKYKQSLSFENWIEWKQIQIPQNGDYTGITRITSETDLYLPMQSLFGQKLP